MLSMKSRKIGDVLVVQCDGAIVYREEAAQFRQTMKDLMQDSLHIVLGLAEVRTIDSNGLGTLVGLLSSAEAAGGELKLAALGPRVKDALLVAKLGWLFKIYSTVDEAVEAFRLEATPLAVGELDR